EAEQDRAAVLIQQGEGRGRSELEATLPVQAHLAHGGSTGERTSELDFLRLGAGACGEQREAGRQGREQALRKLACRRRHGSPFALTSATGSRTRTAGRSRARPVPGRCSSTCLRPSRCSGPGG